jgi:hypothetical protein
MNPVHIVTYLLKARTVEPEKQPLLVNGSEIIFLSRQRLGKHIRIGLQQYRYCWKRCFLRWSVPRRYKEENCGNRVSNPRGGGVKYLHRDTACLKSETVKYAREFQGTRTRERLRWQGPAAYTNERTVLSSERAPHKNKTVSNSYKYLVMITKWGSTPRLTD